MRAASLEKAVAKSLSNFESRRTRTIHSEKEAVEIEVICFQLVYDKEIAETWGGLPNRKQIAIEAGSGIDR